jgi:predicted phosphohydrolase
VIALFSKELCRSWLTGQEREPRRQRISFNALKPTKKHFLNMIIYPPEKQKNNSAVNNSEIFWYYD